jgi:hypothetical protein
MDDAIKCEIWERDRLVQRIEQDCRAALLLQLATLIGASRSLAALIVSNELLASNLGAEQQLSGVNLTQSSWL